MLLAPHELELFPKLHRSLMCFVNQQLEFVPEFQRPDQYPALSPETQLEPRNALLNKPELLQAFANANPFDLAAEELEIVTLWRHYVAGNSSSSAV
jgi:hypothetical protein